jgi:hypothetical protein
MTHVSLEFHLVCPKRFLRLWYVRHKPCTYLASRLALYSNGLNRASTWASSLGVPSGASKTIYMPMVIRCKPCTYLASRLALYQMNWVKHLLELRHLGVLSGASKTISEPMVCLAQTMHRSFTDTNTIFKWTKIRFHMTHVTLDFHRVRPKWFLRLWFVRHKLCTYLASRLALSLNGPNRASTWALSPRSTIECVQNDCWAYGIFGAKRALILRQVWHYLQSG